MTLAFSHNISGGNFTTARPYVRNPLISPPRRRAAYTVPPRVPFSLRTAHVSARHGRHVCHTSSPSRSAW